MTTPAAKPKTDPPAEVLARPAKLSEAARRLLEAGHTAPQYAKRLLAAEHYQDAVIFLAHALPRRAGTWWGCLSLWRLAGPDLPPQERDRLGATVAWVLDPTDDHRRAAAQQGKESGNDTPAGWLAVTAGIDDGVDPGEEPASPMAAGGILCALELTVALADPLQADDNRHHIAVLGQEMLGGKYCFPKAKKRSDGDGQGRRENRESKRDRESKSKG
jgi:Family of unknown function (DUF6931)